MKENVDKVTSLQRLSDAYCPNSGQLVNLAKSIIFFSPNTNVLVRADICSKLYINTGALLDKYLGHLALVGADRSDCFMHLNIDCWREGLRRWLNALCLCDVGVQNTERGMQECC
jgi:hypothetical protein